MKVAVLTTVGDRCGIAAYSHELIEGLRSLPDTEVLVEPITPGRQPIEHYREQMTRLNSPAIDVVHIQHEHSFWGGIMPHSSAYWELRYLLRKPIVLTAHTTYSLETLLKVKSERRPLKLIAKKILLRNRAYRDSVETAPFATAYTIVHTSAARNELIARGVNSAYITVVPTGIPSPVEPAGDTGEFRARFNLGSSRLLTIFGFVAPNKGYEISLKALQQLPNDIHLVIAGGPRNAEMQPYLEELKREIAGLELSNRVTITGYLSDAEVSQAVNAADIVAAPHTQATGSYSITLPLTHGRPIITSDMDCFKEINDRVNCLELFRANDVDDLATRTRSLFDDEERRNLLSSRAASYAARFAWPKVAAMTRKVYTSAIEVYSAGHHGIS